MEYRKQMFTKQFTLSVRLACPQDLAKRSGIRATAAER
ncbi:hypothetical protein RintRC_6532 [Richelia intracellularis]|nr:hypothetical protein RintRC_6532 [Richelia intracellularis]